MIENTGTETLPEPRLKPEELSHDWLAARVARMIEDDCEIDPAENLIFYGLDSISVMTLAAELKQAGVTIAFEELAREPSVNGWWALIEERRADG